MWISLDTPKFKDTFIGSKIIRLCLNCQKELNINPYLLEKQGWSVSHSRCQRHMHSILQNAGLKDEDILKFFLKTAQDRQRTGGTATRDLTANDSVMLVNWLHNPTSPKSGASGGI